METAPRRAVPGGPVASPACARGSCGSVVLGFGSILAARAIVAFFGDLSETRRWTVTLAYDAATGSPIWMRRYDGPGHSIDYPTDMALSSDGATVYVGGWVGNGGGDGDYGTIAYNAITGDQMWVQVFDGPVGSFDALTALAVGPTQPLVFVTGWSVVDGLGGFDYLTFAYDASTGDVKWRRYYHAPSTKDD